MVSRVPGKSEDRGCKAHGPGTENPWTGEGKEEDLGRECGTGGLWCCGSRGKVRTGDAKPTDLGRKTHGPGTERRRTWDGNVELVVCGVAGPGKYCPWSVKWFGTWDGNVGLVVCGVAGPGEK